MEVKVNSQKTNPQQNQNNAKAQPQIPQTNPELQKIIEDIVAKYLNLTQQNNKTTTNNDFVVKANMKASYIANTLEQVLLTRKKMSMVALGYAVPVLLDSIMLIKKDLERLNNTKVDVKMELFEREVVTIARKNKRITGLRVILTI